jgi:hypothetical protein
MNEGEQVRPGEPVTDDREFQIAWRRFRIAAGAVVVAVLAGAMIAAHAWVSAHDTEPTPYALRARPLPNDHLTGVGATLTRFRATHGSEHQYGAFGPMFADNAGGQVPTYSIANSASPDIVDTLIHAFPDGTAEAAVLDAVQADDLPPDVRLVRTIASDPACKVFAYRSATIAAAGPAADFGDGTVTVKLYSRPAGPYTPDDVEQAYEAVGATNLACD